MIPMHIARQRCAISDDTYMGKAKRLRSAAGLGDVHGGDIKFCRRVYVSREDTYLTLKSPGGLAVHCSTCMSHT